MTKPANDTFAPSTRPLVVGMAAFFGVLAAAAGLMWVWFGTKLFFEMVAAGIAYCFLKQTHEPAPRALLFYWPRSSTGALRACGGCDDARYRKR
jgi:hypothetical protein